MLVSEGRAATAHARRYISQLCKHWAHRFEVRFDDLTGEIVMPSGPCRLEAEPEALRIRVEAQDEDGLIRMQAVVADHLARFAFREPFQVSWARRGDA